MKHSLYLKLAEPRKVKVANDAEAPTIDAPILKIVRVDGPDELHQHTFVHVNFMYGYINSQQQFIPLEQQVHVEFLADVPDDADGIGKNPASGLREKSGSWFTDRTTPAADHKNRVLGDFRMTDLYQHLMAKYEIKGEICVQTAT